MHICCRSPRGERGLKYRAVVELGDGGGRSPRGERGLKFDGRPRLRDIVGRSPRGERGLKCVVEVGVGLHRLSVAPLAGSVD